jgi:hypothetical protein
MARYEALVAADLRGQRTLEPQRHYLDRQLVPRLRARKVWAITVKDIGELIVVGLPIASGTPLGYRNAQRHTLTRAAQARRT